MNEFGKYIFGLSGRFAQLSKEVDTKQEEIKGMHSLKDAIDKRKLVNGELTDDKLLDAALCLSHHLPFTNSSWIEYTNKTYNKLLGINDSLSGFEGIMVYDGGTKLRHPFYGSINLGYVDKPVLNTKFHPERLSEAGGYSWLENCCEITLEYRPVLVLIGHNTQTYEPYGGERDDLEDLDVTQFFRPYGDLIRTDFHGFHLGDEKVERYVQALEKVATDETQPYRDRQNQKKMLTLIREFLESQ